MKHKTRRLNEADANQTPTPPIASSGTPAQQSSDASSGTPAASAEAGNDTANPTTPQNNETSAKKKTPTGEQSKYPITFEAVVNKNVDKSTGYEIFKKEFLYNKLAKRVEEVLNNVDEETKNKISQGMETLKSFVDFNGEDNKQMQYTPFITKVDDFLKDEKVGEALIPQESEEEMPNEEEVVIADEIPVSVPQFQKTSYTGKTQQERGQDTWIKSKMTLMHKQGII